MTNGSVDGLAVTLLLARDTEQTAAFYRDVLGLPLRGEEHGGRHRHYACPLGSVYFTIQSAEDLGAKPEKVFDFLQLCFTTADLDSFLQRLERHNIAPLHPPQKFERTTFVTLMDPDGRHVRVMTPWGPGRQ